METARRMSQRKASNHEETPFISGSMASDGTAKASKHDNFSRSMKMGGFAGDYGEQARSSGWKGMFKSMSWSGGLSGLSKADDRESNDTALLGNATGKPKKRTSWLPDRCCRKPIQRREDLYFEHVQAKNMTLAKMVEGIRIKKNGNWHAMHIRVESLMVRQILPRRENADILLNDGTLFCENTALAALLPAVIAAHKALYFYYI